jgi:cystathionine beta-lyase
MQYDFDQVIERRGTNSLKWTRYGADVLPLWVADMDFPAPEAALSVLREKANHGVLGYELPSRKLSEAVAARLHRLYGWQVSPEAVLATPGVVAGFNLAARAVCQTGEGVLVQPPVYHPFLEVQELTGTVRQLAPLQAVTEGHRLRYEIDWALFEAGVNSEGARTAMFLLCQPHNPIGQIFSRQELAEMAARLLRNETVICSDEIHSELLLGGARNQPMATLSPEIEQQTITLFSSSKTFNLVGLFCGFAVIPNPELRKRYKRAMGQTVAHVNSFGLAAAEVAMSGVCDSWLEELRQYLTGNRDWLVEFVRRELPGVRITVPDATYLAWLDFGDYVRSGKIQGEPQRFLLERARVGLNPGTEFGPGGETCARLNFACPRSILAEAMERIRKACV